MNLNCDPVRSALSAYMDGELSESEASAIDVHLAQCAACAAELAELRGNSEELRELFLGVLAQAPLQAPPRRRSRGLAWGAALAVAASVLLWMPWPAKQAGDRSNAKSQLCSAIRGFLSSKHPSALTERGDLRFELLWEADSQRFAWADSGQGAGQSPYSLRGGGDGERVWIECFGMALEGAREGEARWLPAEMQARWPAGMGPRGLQRLRELERGEFEVRSADRLRGEHWIQVEPKSERDWLSATIHLGGNGEWLAAEWVSSEGLERLQMQPLQRSLRQSEGLLAYGPRERLLLNSDLTRQERDQVLGAMDAQFRDWLSGRSYQDDIEALQGLGYTGGD